MKRQGWICVEVVSCKCQEEALTGHETCASVEKVSWYDILYIYIVGLRSCFHSSPNLSATLIDII